MAKKRKKQASGTINPDYGMGQKSQPSKSKYDNKNYTKRRFNENASAATQKKIDKQKKQLKKQGWIIEGNVAYKKKKSGKTPGDKDPDYIVRAEDNPNAKRAVKTKDPDAYIANQKKKNEKVMENLQSRNQEQISAAVQRDADKGIAQTEQSQEDTFQVDDSQSALNPQGQSIMDDSQNINNNQLELSAEQKQAQSDKVTNAVLAVWNAVDFNPDTYNEAQFNGMMAQALELAANHPFQAAAYTTAIKGMFTAAKSSISRLLSAKSLSKDYSAMVGGSLTTFKPTTKTAKLALGNFKTVFGAGALLWGGATILESVGMGLWAKGEAEEFSNKALEHARLLGEQTGDWTLYDNYVSTLKSLDDEDKWQKFLDLIPFYGQITNTMDKIKTQNLKNKIEIAYNELQRQAGANINGSPGTSFDYSDAKNYAAYKAELERLQTEREAASYQANQDYYLSVQKQLTNYKLAAETAAQKEQADYWAKMKSKQLKTEQDQQQKISEFWFEYKKRAFMLQQNSMSSQLSFGLL